MTVARMDEPFAALDAFIRRIRQNELIRLWQRRRPTVLFIPHDAEEAVLLGARVVEPAGDRPMGPRAFAIMPRSDAPPLRCGVARQEGRRHTRPRCRARSMPPPSRGKRLPPGISVLYLFVIPA